MATFVKATCHCGLNTFKLAFETSALPYSALMCHCNTCRHTTGTLSLVAPDIIQPPLTLDSTEDSLIPASLSNLKEYRTSPNIIRYFCSTCSAHMFLRNTVPNAEWSCEWSVLWGVLERIDGVVRIRRKHIFIGDTLDGGLSDHLPGPRSILGPKSEDVPIGWKANTSAKSSSDADHLPLHCHCKALSFYIKRPSSIMKNHAELVGSPTDRQAPICMQTAHCLCNDCRLCSGNQIMTWASVPLGFTFDSSTHTSIDPSKTELMPKGLNRYSSSPGVHRYSCGTCGAQAFFYREGQSEMDVAIALVDQDAVGGVRAEGWLAWSKEVEYTEYALSKEVAEMLVQGYAAATQESK